MAFYNMRALAGQDGAASCARVVLCIALAMSGGNRATAGYYFNNNKVGIDYIGANLPVNKEIGLANKKVFNLCPNL